MRARIARRAAPVASALLIATFLVAALAPCPPSAAMPIAAVSHLPECHELQAATFLTAACACGCEAHAPIAGASARLGVALLSATLGLAPRLVTERAVIAPPRFEGSFTTPIDHIPLSA